MSDFLKSKFDNISLLLVMVLLGVMVLHIMHHHGDEAVTTWVEQTFTTVLGAYIGLTQAHRIPWGKGGTNGTTKNGNGSTSNTSSATS